MKPDTRQWLVVIAVTLMFCGIGATVASWAIVEADKAGRFDALDRWAARWVR